MTRQTSAILLPVLGGKGSPEQAAIALADYRKYIESVRANLPSSACSFADHRCPHDSWVESIVVSEPSSGRRHEKREIVIEIRLLGAHQDGHLVLLYPGVRSYSLSHEDLSSKTGHGDWRTDEISLSDNNLALHEILFQSGGRWLVESSDIVVHWEPIIAPPSF